MIKYTPEHMHCVATFFGVYMCVRVFVSPGSNAGVCYACFCVCPCLFVVWFVRVLLLPVLVFAYHATDHAADTSTHTCTTHTHTHTYTHTHTHTHSHTHTHTHIHTHTHAHTHTHIHARTHTHMVHRSIRPNKQRHGSV